MLFHLSTNPDLKVLEPRVPDSAIDGYEDTKTPRVCFATSINGCLQALQVSEVYNSHGNGHEYGSTNTGNGNAYDANITLTGNYLNERSLFLKSYIDYDKENLAAYISSHFRQGKHQAYYVYAPAHKVNAKPAPVFDQKITGEYWVEEPVELVKIGGVIVISVFTLYNFYTAKLDNGKKRILDLHAYEYVRTPPDYIFLTDIYMKDHPNEAELRPTEEEKDNTVTDIIHVIATELNKKNK